MRWPSDAALGNVDSKGDSTGPPGTKVHSQSCCAVLLADEEMMRGQVQHIGLQIQPKTPSVPQ